MSITATAPSIHGVADVTAEAETHEGGVTGTFTTLALLFHDENGGQVRVRAFFEQATATRAHEIAAAINSAPARSLQLEAV